MPKRLSYAGATALVLVAGAAVPFQAGPAGAAAAYTCGSVRGGSVTSRPIPVVDVRVGRHAGFDRFVVQFSGDRVSAYTVTPKSSAVFWLDPSGRRVTLRGTAGLKIVLHHATGQRSYHGPTDIKPAYPQLREARRIGDFEGVTTWGLGLHRTACHRVFTLSHPARLVIDVPH